MPSWVKAFAKTPRVDQAEVTIVSQGSMAPDSKDGFARWLVQDRGVVWCGERDVGMPAVVEVRWRRMQRAMVVKTVDRVIAIRIVVVIVIVVNEIWSCAKCRSLVLV